MDQDKRNFSNSPFFHAMGILGDRIGLSALWVVCSLPLFTLGADTWAAFSSRR